MHAMTINQLSIFIENKSGTLITVLEKLKTSGIQIIAMSIADTAEYGICRIICDSPAIAYERLKADGLAVSLCEVYAIQLDDTPGAAADAISIFAHEGISIAYLYSFRIAGKGILIFRTDNPAKAEATIQHENLPVISADGLAALL